MLTLKWDSSAGATQYHVQVSTSSLFQNLVVDDSSITTLSRKVGPLLNNTTYYWRVRAKNVGGLSPFSSTWSFTPAYPNQYILNKTWSFRDLSSPSDYKDFDYQIVGLPGTTTTPVRTFWAAHRGPTGRCTGTMVRTTNYLEVVNKESPFIF